MAESPQPLAAATVEAPRPGPRRPRFFPAVRRGEPSPARVAQMEVELRMISRDQRDLRRSRIVESTTCSTRWGDDVWEEGAEYPPGLKQTFMVACCVCHRFTPPQCTRPMAPGDPRRRCEECVAMSLEDLIITDEGPRPGPAYTTPGSLSVVSIFHFPKPDRDRIRRTGRVAS